MAAGPADTLRGLSAVRPRRRSTVAPSTWPGPLTARRATRGCRVVHRCAAAGGDRSRPRPADDGGGCAAGRGREHGVGVLEDRRRRHRASRHRRPTGVHRAFDQVTSRWTPATMLTFPAPARLPATVTVRVETDSGPVAGQVVAPPATAAPDDNGWDSPVAVAVGGLVAVVLAVGLVALIRRRSGRDTASAKPPTSRRPRVPEGQIWNIPVRPEAPVDRTRCWRACAPHAGGRCGCGPTGRAGRDHTMIDSRTGTAPYDVRGGPGARSDLVPTGWRSLRIPRLRRQSCGPATGSTARVLSRRHRWLLVFYDAGSLPMALPVPAVRARRRAIASSNPNGWHATRCGTGFHPALNRWRCCALRFRIVAPPVDRLAAPSAICRGGRSGGRLASPTRPASTPSAPSPGSAGSAERGLPVLLDRLPRHRRLGPAPPRRLAGTAPSRSRLVPKHRCPDRSPPRRAAGRRRAPGAAAPPGLSRSRGRSHGTRAAGCSSISPADPAPTWRTAIAVRLLRAAGRTPAAEPSAAVRDSCCRTLAATARRTSILWPRRGCYSLRPRLLRVRAGRVGQGAARGRLRVRCRRSTARLRRVARDTGPRATALNSDPEGAAFAAPVCGGLDQPPLEKLPPLVSE